MRDYRLLERLGGGGFGVVHSCERMRDREVFAVKLLTDRRSGAQDRFRREVRLQSELRHAHIVTVVDRELDSTPLWYVMPLYKSSLALALPDIASDLGRLRSVFSATLAAIAFAHEQSVIHRDLKPANVLINDGHDVVVSDFGLGRRLHTTSVMTRSLQGMGTPGYAAPEQWKDAKRVDERADVFSLGRILHALYLGADPPPLPDFGGLPEPIAEIVRQATHLSPGDRFPAAGAMRAAFEALGSTAPIP